MPDDESSPAFKARHAELMALSHGAKPPRKVGRPPKRPILLKPDATKSSVGYFAKLWQASVYMATDDARRTSESLALGTIVNYKGAIEQMREDGTLDKKFVDLNPHKANLYIQRIKRERGGSAALMHKTVLSNLWRFARGFPEFEVGDKPNPFKGGEIDTPYVVEQEHMPWPEAVIDAFLETADPNLTFAFYLLLCTGQRVSDVVRMKWEQYDGTYIELREGQKKDRQKTPMKIRVPRLLKAELDARERVSPFILTHKWQRPYTRDSLGHRIKEVLAEIGGGDYTTHGLRKNAGIMLAENGATVPQIMAALGHRTPKMALYYARLANQRLLSDQAAQIIDLAFGKAMAERTARRRAKLRAV